MSGDTVLTLGAFLSPENGLRFGIKDIRNQTHVSATLKTCFKCVL